MFDRLFLALCLLSNLAFAWIIGAGEGAILGPFQGFLIVTNTLVVGFASRSIAQERH